MYRILSYIFLFLLGLLSANGQSVRTYESERTKEFRHVAGRIIQYDTDVDFQKIPGLVVGMIDQDSTYIIDIGTAQKGENIRITDRTIFELGSLTKVFTATLVALLVEENILNYKEPINKLLPDSCYNATAAHLTLKDLLMHTAGLPLLPRDFSLKQVNPNTPYAHYLKSDVLAYYTTFKFDKKEKKYIYSHLNYALLELIVEHQTKQDYKELIQEKIFKPLGMKDSHFGINEKLIKRLCTGYALSGEPAILQTYPAFEGALGLKSTLHDVMIFIRTCMGLEHQKFTPIFATCFQEKRPIHLQENINISYAWHSLSHKKYFDVVLHPGRSSGYQISVHFVPETQTGVVIMANSLEKLDNLGYLMLALVNKHWKLKGKYKKMWKAERRK